MLNGRPGYIICNLAGLIFCTVPVTVAILLYFPLWTNKGASSLLSGCSLLLLLMAVSPIIKVIKRLLRTPSSYVMWFFAFIIFFMLSEISKDMTVICFVGFVSNLVGALFFKLSKRSTYKKEIKNEGQI